MVLWIIRDGEKSGPFEDYEVREMIRMGDVNRETKVWHEGAGGWVCAEEVSVLGGEFEEVAVVPPPIPLMREPFRAWRRFGARAFDSFLYSLILAAVARLADVSLIPKEGEVMSPWFIIGTVFPVVLIEAALLGSVGWTPGKWLLRMRVEMLDGRALTTGQAFVRSMRVWILGMGMRQPILMVLGHLLSLWFGLKKGALLWDLQSGFEVRSGKLTAKWVWAYWLVFAAMIGLSFWVIWPEVAPIYEEMQREIEGQIVLGQ